MKNTTLCYIEQDGNYLLRKPDLRARARSALGSGSAAVTSPGCTAGDDRKAGENAGCYQKQ